MSDSENYTKGELYQQPNYPETVKAKQGTLGRRICCTESMGDKDQNRGNARRIVAAWNACKGISTQALEGRNLPPEAITSLWEAIGWHTQQVVQTGDPTPGPKLTAAVDLVAALLTVAKPEPAVTGPVLTDEQIDAVVEQMPDGALGFLKSWGYVHFARQIIAMVTPAAATPPAPAIADAARLLRAAAHELQQSHTTSRDRNDWTGEEGAKASYDEHMAAAAALEGMGQPQADKPAGQAEMDAWREGAHFALKAVSEVSSICWLTDDMKVVCIKLAAKAVIAERQRQRAAQEAKQGEKP